ncbi:MAG TPA: peptidase S41 [Oceanithermus profundus]|uniref:Peptidase S41 n=1 Tax=Oceanithermus profundus TaxID=187137 RepID=A0A7C4ZH22_9DEIN|nr:peptidase S41 [Oceanithermus profundus]
MRRAAWFLLLLAGFAWAGSSEYLVRFEQVWRLVDEYYWDPQHGGIDWDAVGERYRAQVAEADGWDEVYRLLDRMYGELGDDHSSVLSPEEARAALGGSLCLSLPFPTPRPRPNVREDAAGEPGGTQAPDRSAGAAEDDLPVWEDFRYEVLEGGIAYLRLPQLVDPTVADALAEAVRELESEQVRAYVLDLRDNPGGLAYVMAQVAGVFMRGLPWRIVTRTKGVMPQPTLPFWGRPLTEKPLVVLINGNVHSAAEGLAGALARAGRARLVGEVTAGNTEVVLPYCLPDGGVAMLASGVLAPIGAPTWEGRGVEPDVVASDDPLEAALELLRAP